MHKLAIAPTLVAALLMTACDDSPNPNAAAPTIAIVQTASFDVTPSTLVAQPVGNPVCPATPPFRLPFSVSVRGGDVNVSITDITMRFTDTRGVQMPQVTLPAPALTTQFGSTLVEARKERTLPLLLRLGCGTGTRGTLTVIINTRDDRGRMESTEMHVPVR